MERTEKMNNKKEVFIEGMMCQNCAKHVTAALESISGVTGARVNLDQKKAVIDLSEPVSEEAIRSAVTEAGYEVRAIKACET